MKGPRALRHWLRELGLAVCLATAVAGCTVQGAGAGDDDDDDGQSAAGTAFELSPGDGFDVFTLSKLGGVQAYDPAVHDSQLVYPSQSPCTTLEAHGQPFEVPAACGTLWHKVSGQQYDTFDAAFAALKTTDITKLEKSYFAWSVNDATDVHWAVVLGTDDGHTYVFWLEGLSEEGALRFQYAQATALTE